MWSVIAYCSPIPIVNSVPFAFDVPTTAPVRVASLSYRYIPNLM
jgi:hypothetical protein